MDSRINGAFHTFLADHSRLLLHNRKVAVLKEGVSHSSCLPKGKSQADPLPPIKNPYN
jgi:hypothetical protein